MKKTISIIIIIIVLLSLSSCWSSVEPKNLAIVNSIIYDYKENQFYVTVEFANPSAMGTDGTGGDANPQLTTKANAYSMPEALRMVSSTMERVVFGGHNRVRFLTESFSLNRYAVNNLIDYILRDNLTDEKAYVVVIKDEHADKLYEATLGLSILMGDYIYSLEEMQPHVAPIGIFPTTLEFTKKIYAQGIQPVAGLIAVIKENTEPSSNDGTDAQEEEIYIVKYEGLAVFKDSALMGYLNGEETGVYNILSNNVLGSINYSLRQGEDSASVKMRNIKSDISVKADAGNIVADVKVSAKLMLNNFYTEGVTEENYEQRLEEMRMQFNQEMEERIRNTIFKVQQEYGSDIFGFGAKLRAKQPKVWKGVSSNWDERFTNIIVNISIDTVVDREGEIDGAWRRYE